MTTTTTTRPSTGGTGSSQNLRPPAAITKGNVLVSWLTTTDHKKIG
jgi:cytochrome c oxidase subunit I